MRINRLGLGFGGKRPGVTVGTAPVITGTPLIGDDTITVTGDLPMTFYSVTTASATPPSAATIKSAPDDTIVLAAGANYMPALDLQIVPGTWYLHYLASNAAGDSAIQTDTYIISTPPIQFVGGKTWTTAGTTGNSTISLTDLTGGLAAAPAAGDFVVVAYNIASIGTDRDVAVTGYTEVADLLSTATESANLGLFYKFMPGTPDTTVEVGQTFSTGFAGAVAIQVWRNVNVTTPLDVTTTTATGANSSYANPPSITPTTADAIIICAGAAGYNGDGTWTYTSGDLSNFRFAAVEGSNRSSIIGMGSKAWTGGAFDAAAFGGLYSFGSNAWAAVSIALRPA